MSIEFVLKKYDWVDALRGYAIILVIMIHTSQFFTVTGVLRRITSLGDLGVQLFFILSSFTLFNSYKKRADIDGANTDKFFFIRRFFRIAPMYYLALVIYVSISIIRPGSFVGEAVNYIKVLASFLFLNTFYPPGINYLPPGGWSIGVEMIFYLIIPFLCKQVRNLKQSLLTLLGAVILSNLLNLILYSYINNYTDVNWSVIRGGFLYFWLPNQFPVFMFGVVIYYLLKKIDISKAFSNILVVISFLLFFSFSLYDFSLAYPQYFVQREYIYSIIFLIFILGVSGSNIKVLINKYICNLGKVSFSVYLLHFLVIRIVYRLFVFLPGDNMANSKFLIGFVSSIAASYALSLMTHKYVELRGIKFGNRIIGRIRSSDKLLISKI